MNTKKLKLMLVISLVVLATVVFLYAKALNELRDYKDGSTSILQSPSVQGEMGIKILR